MGAVPSQLVEGKDNTDPKMKAFVAVFAGIAAANAAPKADPWLLAHPFYLGDAHTQTSSDLVEYPNGAKVPDNTLSIKPKDSGLIFTASSGAVTPDFTAEQKETNPEIAEGSESIKVPAWTGEYHVLGKREAKPYYGLGYGYGGYGLGYGGYAYWG